jgi:hypothetical protein
VAEFHIGSVSGGQNNFGGHHNTFNQANQGTDVASLVTLLRGRLDDFTDPVAADQALTAVADDPHSSRAQELVNHVLGWVKPGAEALTAATALVTAVRGVTG